MTDSTAPTPPPEKRRQFSLGNLIVFTPVIPAIVAVVLQYVQAANYRATLEQQTWQESAASRELHRLHKWEETQSLLNEFSDEEPRAIHVSLVPSNSDEEWFWQIYSPYTYEIKFAFENIPAEGLPPKMQLGGGRCSTATWFKIKLHEPSSNKHLPDNQGIQMASVHGRGQAGTAGTSFVDYPRKLYVWQAAGRGKRESFPWEEPLVLLRMRDKPPPAAGDDWNEPDTPGRGVMVWMEKMRYVKGLPQPSVSGN